MKNYSNKNPLESSETTFLAMVIHDLKTPIIAEICALETLLKNKPPSSFEYALINDMLEAAKYMKTLVENLLIKYKTETNQLILQPEPCPIENIIQKCIEETHYLIKDKKQKITFKNQTKDSVCNVDFIEIKRTIHNLLTNANQHSKTKANINIILKETDTDFIIEITNPNNISTNPNFSKDIFDKYIEHSQSSKTVNTGLGLYICKQIIELHNGKIYHKKLPRNKTLFGFNLPKQ